MNLSWTVFLSGCPLPRLPLQCSSCCCPFNHLLSRQRGDAYVEGQVAEVYCDIYPITGNLISMSHQNEYVIVCKLEWPLCLWSQEQVLVMFLSSLQTNQLVSTVPP